MQDDKKQADDFPENEIQGVPPNWYLRIIIRRLQKAAKKLISDVEEKQDTDTSDRE